MPDKILAPGTRVSIYGHFEWPDGTTGRTADWPKCVRELTGEHWDPEQPRVVVSPKGVEETYWIWFDEPADDGSGDGPYKGAEVGREYLRLVGGLDAPAT